MSQLNQTTKLSLNVDFILEGATFPESLLATIKDAVESSIRLATLEGQITPDENELIGIRLDSIKQSKPVVNVILDNGHIDRVITNDDNLVVNVFDEAGDSADNECYNHNGTDVYLHSNTIVESCPDVSDKWLIEANAYTTIHDDDFIDTSLEEIIENRPEIQKRVTNIESDPAWLQEKAYEAFVIIGGDIYLLKQFTTSLELDISVSVWKDILTRL